MTHTYLLALPAATLLFLTACSETVSEPDDVLSTSDGLEEAYTPSSETQIPTNTIGGDGSSITLNTLTGADLAHVDRGELFCTFISNTDQTLVVASGDANSNAPAKGVIKVGDYVEPLQNTSGKGFGAMYENAKFVGQGKTVTIEVSGDTQDNKSSKRKASLTYQRADGAERQFEGVWSCGA